MTDPIRVAVFASGRGSNFRALHEYLIAEKNSPAQVVLCISNNPSPGVFDYAHSVGIPTLRLSPRMFDTPELYADALLTALHQAGIGMIVLAGYMRLLPPIVVQEFRGRILNIHPALLPKFGGKGMFGDNVHNAVLSAAEKETGATVHLVDDEYDTGAIIAQESIPVLPDDTAATLAERVLAVEHRLLPQTVVAVARQLLARRGQPES